MKYYFRNQNNYANIPYPSNMHPQATVKSGGCGICSACNALDNLFGKVIYDVKTMAEFSIKNGGRVSYGTDMGVLLKKLKSKLGTFTYTYHIQEGIGDALINHLKKGGTAILSTLGGSSAPNGLFSTGGHLYCAVGYSGNYIYILDSGYYTGKYLTNNRRKYAKAQGLEPYIVVHKSYVEKASQNGGWLLTSTKKTTKAPAQTTSKSIPKTYYCNTTSGLQFRKSPSTKSVLTDGQNSGKSIIGYGDAVTVDNIKYKVADGYTWAKIKYRGVSGYVANKFLQTKAPASKTVNIPKGYNLRTSVGKNSKNIAKTTTSKLKVSLLANGCWASGGEKWSRIKTNGITYYVAYKW